MTEQDVELLSRYLDGELDTAATRQLEQRLTAEPALRDELLKMREINETLRNTFRTSRARKVPERIISMVKRPRSRVVQFPGQQRKAGWGFAIAASIMAASGLLFVQGTGQRLAGDSPQLDALLAQNLESTPSRGDGWDLLADGRRVRPVLSYAKIDGGWCREYLLSDATGTWQGVACREQGQWNSRLKSKHALTESSDEYRAAGATDTDQIANFMKDNAADIALSAKREEELIATGWR